MSMSSEEKISPEEFDKELDSLLAGTTEKKPKNPKRKKIIIAAAIAILGITGIKLLSGGKDMVPVVDTVTPTRKTIQNRLTVTGPISGTDSVDVVSNLHAEILEIPVKEGDKVTKRPASGSPRRFRRKKRSRHRQKRLRPRRDHLRRKR